MKKDFEVPLLYRYRDSKTGFTIMAFHNDIGIREVFEQISSLITGESGKGMLTIEIAYALGLPYKTPCKKSHNAFRRIFNRSQYHTAV